ncbi:Apolipophorin, partial [Operophtera brumata]
LREDAASGPVEGRRRPDDQHLLQARHHQSRGVWTEEEAEEAKENKGAGHSGTLTLKKKSQLKDRDLQFEQLSKKLKTDDNVEWIDTHKTLSEACVGPQATVLLKRRLYYSDRNVDSRDPVQLNLL